jgi:polysaccharide export outer membrane protein
MSVNAFEFLLICACTGASLAQTVVKAPSSWIDPSRANSKADLAQLMSAREIAVTIEKYDLISIQVYGAEAISVKGRITPEGGFDIPLVGHVVLGGLTIEEADRKIADVLRQDSLVNTPAVTIEVLESPARVVTVSGEVAKPGVYPVFGDSQITAAGSISTTGGVHTLSQALSIAGGLKDTAADTVTLVRPSLTTPVEIPLGRDPTRQMYLNVPVFAGDQITVPNVGRAYVVGAVKKQGIIPLKNYSPTTVGQAVSISDGIGFEASPGDACLVRTSGTGRVVLKVNVKKILEGRTADVALQNDDILYIPTNLGKAALKSGAAGLIVSLASTYIYAHP